VTIPGIDLTGFDLARLDPTRLDLTRLDPTRVDLARLESLLDQAAETAQDAVYVSVGLGILAFQRAQVRRRELNRGLDDLRRCITPG
jgi:hypothetical protein